MKVFIMAGQSNMVGHGIMGEVPPIVDEKVKIFRGESWEVATEPFNPTLGANRGVSLGPSFAAKLREKDDVEIGFIFCPVGSSWLHQWLPGAEFYEEAVKRSKAGLEGNELAGILWLQGEQDCDTDEHANTYYDRFMTFINAFSKELGAEDVPVIISELGDYLRTYDYCKDRYQVINKEIGKIVASSPRFELVNADGFAPNNEEDPAHLNGKSQRELGRRFAAPWEKVSARLGVSL